MKLDSPMLHYTLAYFYEQDRDRARANSEYIRGAKSDPAFVFPHRVEEIAYERPGASRLIQAHPMYPSAGSSAATAKAMS